MNDHWKTLPNAHLVLEHMDDARPAWLWSQDGQRLIWANRAAGLFQARLKKHGLKKTDMAAPIKGQVARTIRLGSPGRSSLARIQFLAGQKPVSATCTTTPLQWGSGETALLIVAVDPIAADVLAADREDSAPSPSAPSEDWQAAEGAALPFADEGAISSVGEGLPADLPDDEDIVLPSDIDADDHSYAQELQSWREADAEHVYEAATDNLPGDSHADAAPPAEPSKAGDAFFRAWDESHATGGQAETGEEPHHTSDVSRRLSDLVSKLAADDALYTPLTEADDFPPDGALEDAGSSAEDRPSRLYKVTGRGFIALLDATEPSDNGDPIEDGQKAQMSVPEAEPAETAPDAEAVERVSRYNFDELSRILSDRVGDRKQAAPVPSETPAPATTGALVNLSGETLVLNRLPLGILVFRDQQILFANRAITEMVGYDSVDSLRQAGLGAVFPAMGEEGQQAGPVNHLVTRDGALVPVTARLQSTSWQGRPALMLSASTTEVRTGHEDAVKAFAHTFADIRGDGFIEANRNGVVSAANASAASLLSANTGLRGQALSSFVGQDDGVALRGFLERPARFAETARPCLTLRSSDGRADILLFALGQAGVISGYFGFVRARETAPARLGGVADVDPALLARISRGVRRPLNTIIGFSDIMRSQTFGAIGDERYQGYADDISRAGQEIAALVDELDDYARLRDGRYLPQRASLDLTSLLESCVVRIRDQANAARVIVRNAISEHLPRVTADRASLAQAVLNLLASAIDQTPQGGAVVISAQHLDDGAIAIHVRDSSVHAVDMAERFVVFRDGVDKDGQILAPVRSSVGLALTRSLLAVNAVSLSVDPAGPEGMLFTLKIPADLVDFRNQADP